MDFPFHDKTGILSKCGRICFNRHSFKPGPVLPRQAHGAIFKDGNPEEENENDL